MGSPSEIVKATTKGSKPEDPPSNADKFVIVNVSWITLHLGMWNDGGCPITYFELEYRKNGENIWTSVSNNIEVMKDFGYIHFYLSLITVASRTAFSNGTNLLLRVGQTIVITGTSRRSYARIKRHGSSILR